MQYEDTSYFDTDVEFCQIFSLRFNEIESRNISGDIDQILISHALSLTHPGRLEQMMLEIYRKNIFNFTSSSILAFFWPFRFITLLII